MPTKKYKKYVEEHIDEYKLEELKMMKESLQNMGIIEKISMGMGMGIVRGDLEA